MDVEVVVRRVLDDLPDEVSVGRDTAVEAHCLPAGSAEEADDDRTVLASRRLVDVELGRRGDVLDAEVVTDRPLPRVEGHADRARAVGVAISADLLRTIERCGDRSAARPLGHPGGQGRTGKKSEEEGGGTDEGDESSSAHGSGSCVDAAAW